MAKLIRRFLEWASGRKWRVTLRVNDMDDVPDMLGRRDIVLVAAPAFTKWIVFDCPCGTGHRIMLNADKSRKPRWEMRAEDPSAIFPSVDFQSPERRCHYVIAGGRTHWTRDSD